MWFNIIINISLLIIIPLCIVLNSYASIAINQNPQQANSQAAKVNGGGNQTIQINNSDDVEINVNEIDIDKLAKKLASKIPT